METATSMTRKKKGKMKKQALKDFIQLIAVCKQNVTIYIK